MSAPVLVTGGAGFIGSHLAERLAREGRRVRVLDDFSSGRDENLASAGGRVELHRADVRDPAALGRAMRGAELVFHLAAVPSVPASVADPIGTHDRNLGGTLAVLEAARSSGVRRVVFASSCAVYGDAQALPVAEDAPPRPLSPYAVQKLAGEHYCALYARRGLETVALRYFNVFGPRQDPASDYAAAIPRFVRAARCGEAIRVFGHGEQTRDFVHVSDVVEANLRAAAAPDAAGCVLNVASGRRTSVNELVSALSACARRPLQVLHGAARPGDLLHSWAEVSRARALLGFDARVELRDGLRDMLDAEPEGTGAAGAMGSTGTGGKGVAP